MGQYIVFVTIIELYYYPSNRMKEIPILVINLPERTDRWKQIQEDFHKKWPGVYLERIDAVKASPGWIGCLRSHKKAVQIAKKRKYPFVLVLEDDCLPADDSFERFEELIPLLQKNKGWEIFSGGTTFVNDISLINKSPPLFEVKSYATQFVLIHERAYDKILDGSEKKPVDMFYRKNFTTFCTYPHLATQTISQSNIENKISNYNQAFEKSSKKLKAVLEGKKGDTQKGGSEQYNYEKPLLLGLLTLLGISFLMRKY
jgi:GR25 family glycosyltransferase involved in LPS biosynthesis